MAGSYRTRGLASSTRGSSSMNRAFDMRSDATKTILVDDGAWMTYLGKLLTLPEASDLFTMLHSTITNKNASMLWKREAENRFACAVGDAGRRYRYANAEHMAHPWPAAMESVRDRVRERVGCMFDFALLNLYVDGLGALGWHSDKETDLEPGAPVASVSLGAERAFQWRAIDETKATGTLLLEEGSLLVMGGTMQERFEHCVPPRLKVDRPRINITFRKLR